jgi:autotransporter-associated beta strand protein
VRCVGGVSFRSRGFSVCRIRLEALAALLIAVGLAALSGSPVHAQWLEAGPFTSTSTLPSTPGNLSSNDLVYGMPAQGNPVYGATNVILQSQNDPTGGTYWVTTVSGGIWKTTNGGVTWAPTTDNQPSLSIGAITVDTADPTGKTMYAATGYYSAGGVNLAPQTTILKSTDGGNSWQALSSTGIQNLFLDSSGHASADTAAPASIKNIVAMGNVVLVAAALSNGHDSNNTAGGLYRSTDGGLTFSLVPTFNTEVTNLISTTINNQTVLIAARDGAAYHPDNGILYSTDAGVTWTTLLAPGTPLLPTNSSNPGNLVFSGANDNLNIKVAAGLGDSLFVAVVKNITNSHGVTISEPTGLYYTPHFTPGTTPTWYNLGEVQFTTASGTCTGGCTLQGNLQGNIHFALVADPKQAGVAYIAGSGIFISGASDEIASMVRVNYDATTNAATYTPIVFPTPNSSPHPDTRSLVINSQGNLLTTDDGGVYALTNPSTSTGTWTALGGVAADGSPIRAIETYSAAMDPKTGRLVFASQDNGAGLSPPSATLAQITPGAGQNTLGGDGFSVAVNYKTSAPSIFYETADARQLARVFANQNLSLASPPNLLDINVAGTGGQNYLDYQGDNANGIVVAVNAVDPTKLLFRSSRLYTWTDPGTALSGSIDITDISTGNIFDPSAWTEKIAYGTHGAPDAILAGGPLAGGGLGVFLRTQEQVNSALPIVGFSNLLTSYIGANPVGVLFDPATEHKFFITDVHNVYATKDTGHTLTALVLPANFQNPAGLAYIADANGNANNGVRALLVGGTSTVANSTGSIISTLDPFATNVQWMNFGAGLPNAVVYGLNYYPDIDTLVAATYGRGVYILYDVTSHYSTATALWFGKANNDSTPDPSLLTGNRPLDKFGTGTLTLTGPATYSGGTFVFGGTLAVGSDAALGDPSGQIGIDAGTWAVTSSFSTARTVAFGVDGGTVDVGPFSLTASGLWAAQGPVNKTGSGVLALQGLGFFQDFMVSAGTLEVDGSFSGTSLQVAMGAALTGTGQIAAPTTISGILAPGDALGILTFTAPVTLTPSSNLRIAIDGTSTGGGVGSYSQVIVNGASLTLGGTLSPIFRGISGANNNFTPVLGQQFTVAAASGGVIGQFAGVDLSSTGLSSSLRFDTLYGATAVNLVTTPSFYSVNAFGPAWNANQQSVGVALDLLRPPAGTTSPNTTLQSAFNGLYGLSAAQIGSALTGLSGEGEARAVANTLDTIDALHTALLDHLIGAPVAPGFNNLALNFGGGGGSARNFYAAYNRIPGDRSAPVEKAPSSPSAEPNHWWSSVFYQGNMTDTSAGIAGGTSNVSGFIAGVEGEIRPGLLIGGAISSAHTDASGSSSGTGDNIAFIAYGRQTAGRLQASAYAGYVRDSFGMQHDFGSLGGGAPLKNSGASSLITGGSLAYTFNAGAFQIAPTLTASFTHLLFDGVSVVSPQGFAVALPSQWADRFRLTLGPTVSRSLTTDRGIKLLATVSGGFLYQTNPVTALDGQLFGIPTLAQSAPAGHVGGFADVGLNASFTDKLSGFIRWRGEARDQARSYQLTGGLIATF